MVIRMLRVLVAGLVAVTGLAIGPFEAAARMAAAPGAQPIAPVLQVAGARHADPALETLLPTSLGGVSLTVESQAGTDLSTSSGPFDTFLKSLGKTRADFTLASAYSQGTLKAEIGAWRVKGADEKLLLPGFRIAVQASSTTPLAIAEETLAGHQVTRIGDPGQLTRGPLYVVLKGGDSLLFVQTPEPALAEEAIGKLAD
jgi:hypothetical protein